MMKCCPKCNGHGFELLANRFGRIRKLECDICNGKGYLPMTNEEWFCNLSTKEKAKVIVNIHNLANIKQIEWWLKEIHQ